MGAVTHHLARVIMLLVFGTWAWCMVCVGPRLVGRWFHELPQVGDVSSRWEKPLSALFVAAGIFVFLIVARRCFPLASPKLRIVCEVAPWIGLCGFVIGGLVA